MLRDIILMCYHQKHIGVPALLVCPARKGLLVEPHQIWFPFKANVFEGDLHPFRRYLLNEIALLSSPSAQPMKSTVSTENMQ